MRSDGHGMLTGTSEELTDALAKQVELHSKTMHRSLDMAIELIQYVMSAPITTHKGEQGIEMNPLYVKWEKDLGYEISDDGKDDIFKVFLFQAARFGGSSLCMAWDLAHVIEHSYFHLEN